MSVTETYRVTGMTCAHCVQAVTAELTALPSVTAVQIDLASGDVTLTSQAPVPVDQVASAVDEAGYQLASVHV
jgi:copper chaperone CopZ